MKTTVNRSEFTSAFHRMGRGEQFSHQALLAMFDYFEQLENDCGTEMELDVIAICCEWAEYANLAEFQEAYSDECQTLEDIQDKTQVIMLGDSLDDGFIIQQF